ncbi:LIC10260 family lipoprotein [Leptospira kmetyi]|uniref:LIC10260 family lipoprotein n=1 Tax=Leptospira kmetyi TaxID=408139 RepID=UPI003EBDF68F
MKSKPLIILFLCVWTLIGCSSPPKKISYLSLEKPKDKIDTTISRPTNFWKIRFGIFYLKPVGLHSYLKQAEAESGSPILRNADIRMRAPFCLIPLFPILCFGGEAVVVEGNEVP